MWWSSRQVPWGGHGDGALGNGTSAVRKQAGQSRLAPSHTGWSSEVSSLQLRRGPLLPVTLSLDFQSPQLWAIHFGCLRATECMMFYDTAQVDWDTNLKYTAQWLVTYENTLVITTKNQIQNIFRAPYASLPNLCPHPRVNHCSDFCHLRLTFPILKLYMNEMLQYVLFCFWLLSFNITSAEIHPCFGVYQGFVSFSVAGNILFMNLPQLSYW